MIVHMRAPSGTGKLCLCGMSLDLLTDKVVEDVKRITCQACLDMIEEQAEKVVAAPPPVPRPNSHYDSGGISVIDVIKAKLTPEQYKGFLLGNAIKYALRMNFKGQESSDAAKLDEYTTWLKATTNQEHSS